jgi:pimeloyl-ACP methyl ester carboxylesterase
MLGELGGDLDIVTPAAPGHAGEMMPPDTSLTVDSLAAAALQHVVAAVERAERPIAIGGHSMGAVTAAAIAARRPDLVSALFLEDPPWSWPPSNEPDPDLTEFTEELADWIIGLQHSSHSDRVAWCVDHNPGWPEDEYEVWARSKAEMDPAVFRSQIDMQRFAWRQYADAIQCPVTLLVGEWKRGSVCHPQVADYLEKCGWRIVRIPAAGHDLRRDNRKAVISAFKDVLAEAT